MLYWPAGGVCDVSDCVINAKTRSQNAVGSSLVAAPPEAACPEMSRRELEEEVSFFRNKKNKTETLKLWSGVPLHHFKVVSCSSNEH